MQHSWLPEMSSDYNLDRSTTSMARKPILLHLNAAEEHCIMDTVLNGRVLSLAQQSHLTVV